MALDLDCVVIAGHIHKRAIHHLFRSLAVDVSLENKAEASVFTVQYDRGPADIAESVEHPGFRRCFHLKNTDIILMDFKSIIGRRSRITGW